MVKGIVLKIVRLIRNNERRRNDETVAGRPTRRGRSQVYGSRGKASCRAMAAIRHSVPESANIKAISGFSVFYLPSSPPSFSIIGIITPMQLLGSKITAIAKEMIMKGRWLALSDVNNGKDKKDDSLLCIFSLLQFLTSFANIEMCLCIQGEVG